MSVSSSRSIYKAKSRGGALKSVVLDMMTHLKRSRLLKSLSPTTTLRSSDILGKEDNISRTKSGKSLRKSMKRF